MRAAYYRDAFWLGLAGTGVLLGLTRLQFLLARIWPTAKRALGDGLPAGLDLYVPAASAIGSAVLAGLFVTALVAVAAGFVAGYVRQRWQQLGLILCLAVVMSGGWGDRKSTRLNSSHGYISYAVFCLKKKKDKEV